MKPRFRGHPVVISALEAELRYWNKQRPAPKFGKDQVVMVTVFDIPEPRKIVTRKWKQEERTYMYHCLPDFKGQGIMAENEWREEELRPLTARECGPRTRRRK